MSADIDAESSTLGANSLATADGGLAYAETDFAIAGLRVPTNEPAPGHIGRYRIDLQLGAGGMGEVYLGHDEELDRKVALKRVLPNIADERAQLRLRREARALAKLSHANVVQVYEVGEHEGRTFLAMEYVEGVTLGDWLRTEPRAWGEVVDLFVTAGRGLAAAHAAGIVHRDFKPDNVLLGRDGSVRVADFGLALAGEGPRREVGEVPRGEPRLSTAGAIVGTFRYMPLEQLCGEEVDARSDQFSFCLALYEALWRRQPFEARNFYERITELESKRAKRPPGVRVPRKMWRVIRRGLRREPDQRWPSMHELVDALEAAKKAALRRRYGAVAIVIGFGLNPLIKLCNAEEAPDPCANVTAELEGVWDDSRRAEFESAFADLTEDSVRMASELDAWASAWTSERERNCRAQPVGTDALVHQQLAWSCLVRQRNEVDGLIEQSIERPDARTLARGVAASIDLAAPALCFDPHVLLELNPPSPTLLDAIEDRREQISRARTLRLLGQTELALREIEVLDTGGFGYGPLAAEARAEHAFAELDAGAIERGEALLVEAVDLAEIHHHDRLAAELWTTLADRASSERRDAEATRALLHRAEVAWQRIDSGPRDRARSSIVSARLAMLEGADTNAVEAALREALSSLDERDPERPACHATLAELARARPADALEHRDDALASATEIWGAEHPETAVYRLDLALALRAAGRHEQAREQLARAIATWTRLREHPRRLALALAMLAD